MWENCRGLQGSIAGEDCRGLQGTAGEDCRGLQGTAGDCREDCRGLQGGLQGTVGRIAGLMIKH